jgi:hypothetical protein
MVFLSNPPEADKSLRLPCGMRSLFLWGYAQKIILGISTICLWLFFSHAFLSRYFQRGDLEQKSSFLDGHEIDFQQHDFIRQLKKEIHHAGL